MFKRFCLLLPVVLLSLGCKGTPQPQGVRRSLPPLETLASFLSTPPSGGGLVFLGAAGKRRDREETLRLALEDAARRVSVFHGVSGEYTATEFTGSGAFDYERSTGSAIRYDEAGYLRYLDALEFDPETGVLEVENTLIVKAVYRGALPSAVHFSQALNPGTGRPDWVDTPLVRLGGYEVGTGYAGRHSSMADTFGNSFKSAVLAIVRNLNSSSQSAGTEYQGSGLFDYKITGSGGVSASASLDNFYVLGTWIDPDSLAVWTLAIAGGK